MLAFTNFPLKSTSYGHFLCTAAPSSHPLGQISEWNEWRLFLYETSFLSKFMSPYIWPPQSKKNVFRRFADLHFWRKFVDQAEGGLPIMQIISRSIIAGTQIFRLIIFSLKNLVLCGCCVTFALIINAELLFTEQPYWFLNSIFDTKATRATPLCFVRSYSSNISWDRTKRFSTRKKI